MSAANDSSNIVEGILAINKDVQARYIHSEIFDRLQEDDDDLTGIVAYGIYQKRKRQWIKNFETDNDRTPSEAEVKAYCYTFTPDVLDDLRTQADNLIFRVCDGLIEHRTVEMQSEAFNVKTTQELDHLKNMIEKISGYKHHILGHIVGFVILVILVWFATFLLHNEPSIAHFLHAD